MKRGTLYRVGHLCMLLNFIALVVTGVMRYTQPFSIAVTRVHMLCGFAITLLVAFHIMGRLRQMKHMVKSRNSSHYPSLIISLILTGVYWSAAWFAWPGAKQVVDLSYESRHRKEIFRAKENIISSEKNASTYAFKLTSERASLGVDIDWTQLGIDSDTDGARLRFYPDGDSDTDVAIWVETKSGAMIETFFLSNGLRYSEKLSHKEGEPRRGDILPVWRNRYTAICGIDPEGKLDALSGPTKNHQFDLNNNLSSGEPFSVFVEINASGDDQPSVIYAALVEPASSNPYTLLTLLGTGKDAKLSGSIHYELDEVSTAKQLVEKILVHTVWEKK